VREFYTAFTCDFALRVILCKCGISKWKVTLILFQRLPVNFGMLICLYVCSWRMKEKLAAYVITQDPSSQRCVRARACVCERVHIWLTVIITSLHEQTLEPNFHIIAAPLNIIYRHKFGWITSIMSKAKMIQVNDNIENTKVQTILREFARDLLLANLETVSSANRHQLLSVTRKSSATCHYWFVHSMLTYWNAVDKSVVSTANLFDILQDGQIYSDTVNHL
jgi:hypothetical protein